ncbi:MAG: hypothetical protein QOF84_1270 [Streptomyces sp.]|nr:hypothetical protein [Streptomyces sp.]
MRRLIATAAAAGLAAGALVAATTPSATALTSPVAITADNLSTYQTNGIVWALAEAGGTVFAGGTFSTIRPPGTTAGGTSDQSAVNFAAFDAATGAPTSCSLSFTATSGSATVRALAVSPDKKTLYAGGWFSAVNGVSSSSLAAIDIATCAPIATFKPTFSNTVKAIDVTSDTVYVGGDFVTASSQSRKYFAAFNTAGTLQSWNPAADGGGGRTVKVLPDGAHVALGGLFTTVGGADSHALAVVDSTAGSLTQAYPTGFFDSSSGVKDIITDGTSIYTASEGFGGASFDGRTRISLSDYTQTWRDSCSGATQALAIYQAVLYSANHAHDCSSMGEYPNQTRKHFLAESVDNPAKLSWFPDTNDGLGESIGARDLALSSVGGTEYLWAGGEFTTVNGSAQQGLTRFASTPDTGAPSLPVVTVDSPGPGVAKVRWQAGLDSDDSTLTYKVYRNGSTTPIYTTTGDSLPWVRPQLTFTDTTVTTGSTYSYRVTASDGTNTTALSTSRSVTVASGTNTYREQVVADGPSLYWRYDENSGVNFAADQTAADDSGDEVSSPTHRVTPAAVPGSSTALTLNGTSQFVYSDRLRTAPSTYSVETWFKSTSTSGGRIIGFGNNYGKAQGQWSRQSDRNVYMTDDGRLEFGVTAAGSGGGGPGGTTYSTVTTPSAYNDGTWHHVVATQGDSGLTLYVDGAQVAADSTATANQSYAGYWRVGSEDLSRWPDAPTSSFFAGSVDETAVYPTVLTADQVAQHYSLGTSG